MRFKDRHEGGRVLAGLLSDYARRKDVLILAIPSGGVPVAAELARELACEMDVLVVRTLNLPQHDPWQPEIVMGAVAPGGVPPLFSTDPPPGGGPPRSQGYDAYHSQQ